MTRKSLLTLIIALIAIPVMAQMFNPVRWRATIEIPENSNEGAITMTATIQKGWHMYSLEVDPEAGPQPLAIAFENVKGMELVGALTPSKDAHKEYDDMFGAELSWWTSDITITQKFKPTATDVSADIEITCSACNDQNCIPPSTEILSVSTKYNKSIEVAPAVAAQKPAQTTPVVEAAPETSAQKPAQTTPVVVETPVVAVEETPAVSDDAQEAVIEGVDVKAASQNDGTVDLWAPVSYEEGTTNDFAGTSLWYVFFTCFIGGLLALFTPCVWPMIPMTVSFFLKKGKNRSKAIGDAFVYGASIVVIYVALGLLITAIFGASALNALSTSAVCNLIFFLLLVVFAISFFGAFEIALPASWSAKMDQTAEKTTGLLSIFFMAFTLALVSFSCTGPIIGTLLVEAASTGQSWGPAIGMLGFSLALALPFMLFAMFPTMLQSAPRSGSWMNTLKVVLGFIELALSLKFLSVADLAYGWHILDREVFICLWIAMFGMLGLYLLGKFNFSHYGDADSSIGVGRFFLSMASFAFAIYLLPGLWGAPLKGVSAFVPPLYTQDFNLYGDTFKEYEDYEEGMEAARAAGKPALIDFSGYGCVNCRKMEGAVLDQADVKNTISNNFVVIKLMVDEKTNLPEPIYVEENGKKVKLSTYGDRWSYLQRYKFRANAQPYYVVLNDEGELISGPVSYDEDINNFTNFLQKGIKGYKSAK